MTALASRTQKQSRAADGSSQGRHADIPRVSSAALSEPIVGVVPNFSEGRRPT